MHEANRGYVAVVTRHFATDGKSKSRTKKLPYGVSSETEETVERPTSL